MQSVIYFETGDKFTFDENGICRRFPPKIHRELLLPVVVSTRSMVEYVEKGT